MSTVMLTATPELHARVMERVNWCVERVRDRVHGFQVPTVYYYSGRGAAGVATLRSNTIGLMLPMLEAMPDEMFREIIPHEIAHLACYYLHTLKMCSVQQVNGHGALWKKIMRQWFGVEPRRVMAGSPELDALCGIKRQRRWEYTCACPGRNHKISTSRHNRYKSGKARYRCMHCKTPLIGPWNPGA